ncbi:MAG: ATP synthase subunit I [Gammaproteobacteria bacterium]|nr:ATP synthase subunit I [Gammaproteobacteria bacterium]MBK7730218.1 ATP synthase subunit I [Gammaproteobacteria bacterium]
MLLAESGLLALAVLGAGIMDPVTGKSLLIGGLIFLIPQSWFAWRVFRFSGAGAAREVVQGFYRGEAGKFLLTTAGFASAFLIAGPLQAAALFGAYIVLHVVHWLLLSRFAGI